MKFLPVLLIVIVLAACRTNESPEAQVDDFQITTQVKAKLASDIGVTSVTNISVNSTNGVVTLAGQVDSADIKGKAVEIARAVPKVTRVVDNLQVVTKPTSSYRHRNTTLCQSFVYRQTAC
jgi:osmotically-inducible protein OsmY